MNFSTLKNLVSQKIKSARWRFLQMTGSNTVVKTDGFLIEVSGKDDVIGRNFFFYGRYGMEELEKAYAYLKKNGLKSKGPLIDIGANIGFIALYAITKGHATGALCFEPDANNFALLRKNVLRNGLENKIRVYNLGLASAKSSAQFIVSSDNSGDHRVFTNNELEGDKYSKVERKIVTVELDTLNNIWRNDFASEQPGFVCLDVQGYELEVLKGGSEVFSMSPPLLLEVDPYLLEKKGCTIGELQQVLSGYYSSFVDMALENPAEMPITDFSNYYKSIKDSTIQHKDILFFRK